MPQGKLKVKTKVPDNNKAKQKGKAFTSRSRCPIQAKKLKFAESQKLKHLVTKNVNKHVEREIRDRAVEGKINLSKAQLAVAKHHKDAATNAAANSGAASTAK